MRNISSIMAAGLLLLTACTSTEEQIKQELTEANYCETASDCVDIGSKCPFDCYILVNTAEADRMKIKVESFPSQCQYSCVAIQGVECVQNKCQATPEGNR